MDEKAIDPKSGNRFSEKLMDEKVIDPKSGNRFSDELMDEKRYRPEKWEPVFGKVDGPTIAYRA